MKRLAMVLPLLGLMMAGCAATPATTSILVPATTTSLTSITTTTSTTEERTAITFAVDYAKLEPAWKAYASTISAVEAHLSYDVFQRLLHSLATEVELLAQQNLSEKERSFADDLRAAIESFKTGLSAWELELKTPDPANQTTMQEAWSAARAHGDKAGAILRGE